MSTPDTVARRNRTKLLLIIGLFLLPPVAAWLAWQYIGEVGVRGTTNTGTLVSPARPLAVAGLSGVDGAGITDALLRGRWTYVMFADGGCDQRCQQQLYLTRQIRLGVNKDVRRVQRLLVLDAAPDAAQSQWLASEHGDLVLAVRDATGSRALVDRFHGEGYAPDGSQTFLVDPLGNLMMFYDADVSPKGMIKDLQKLLKVSQIG